jgi:hypothetical protein
MFKPQRFAGAKVQWHLSAPWLSDKDMVKIQ